MMLYITTMAYQQTKLVDDVGVKHTQNYYRAQAGLVDAFWRIRTNRTLDGWTGNFNDPNFSVEYYMDINTNSVSAAKAGASNIKVTIGPKNQTVGSPQFGLRPVTATGIDI